MATTTMKVSEIKVRKGFNVRTKLEGIDELAGSISLLGLLNPLVVSTDGHLIAGHRRLAAVKKAKLAEVDVIVRSNDDQTQISVHGAENVARTQLTAVEEAKAIERLLGAGYSADGAAQALAITKGLVTRRLKLLEIPEPCRSLLWGPGGSARMDAIPFVALLLGRAPGPQAPELADLIAQAHLISHRFVGSSSWRTPPSVDAIIEQPSWYLDQLQNAAGVSFRDDGDDEDDLGEGDEGTLTLPDWPAGVVCETRGRLDTHSLPDDIKTNLTDTYNRGQGAHLYNSPELAERDVDAAVAAGAGVRFPGGEQVILDEQWLHDWVRNDVVPRYEQEIDKAIQASGQANARTAATAQAQGRDLSAAEKKSIARAAATRDAQKKWKGLAPGVNLDLGQALLNDLDTVDVTMDVARFFSETTLGPRTTGYYGNGGPGGVQLAAAGLRYVMPGWQTETVKVLKSGEERRKVEFIDKDEAAKRMWKWIDQADTPGQVLGRTLIVHAAAAWAREECLPMSARIMMDNGGQKDGAAPASTRFTTPTTDAQKLLAKMLKGTIPASVKALAKEIRNFDPDKGA